MAMAIFRKLIHAETGDWCIESAGTWAIEGAPAATKTQLVLKNNGMDISNHRSRMVTEGILESFDLVLTMEKGQKEALVVEFPKFARRVHMLTEMIGLVYDIPDPIGKSMTDFEETYKELEQVLRLGLEKVRRYTR
jgi:protein-tyrosine-phosphatase